MSTWKICDWNFECKYFNKDSERSNNFVKIYKNDFKAQALKSWAMAHTEHIYVCVCLVRHR